MNFNIMFFINSVMLGVALAMDAFSVSLANGLNEADMKIGRMCTIAGVFAGFQAFMPLTGWICVHTVAQYFSAFEKMIPWIALILLLYIGINMLREGASGAEEEALGRELGFSALLIQGIATSIDALSVGFTIADYGPIMAVICATIIAAVTFVICISGLKLGKTVGTRLAGKANILGGVILIIIGIEIFVTGIM